MQYDAELQAQLDVALRKRDLLRVQRQVAAARAPVAAREPTAAPAPPPESKTSAALPPSSGATSPPTRRHGASPARATPSGSPGAGSEISALTGVDGQIIISIATALSSRNRDRDDILSSCPPLTLTRAERDGPDSELPVAGNRLFGVGSPYRLDLTRCRLEHLTPRRLALLICRDHETASTTLSARVTGLAECLT